MEKKRTRVQSGKEIQGQLLASVNGWCCGERKSEKGMKGEVRRGKQMVEKERSKGIKGKERDGQ